jgi:hypothetical protein
MSDHNLPPQSPMLTIRKCNTDTHGLKLAKPVISLQIDDGAEFVCSPEHLQRWCDHALGNPYPERIVALELAPFSQMFELVTPETLKRDAPAYNEAMEKRAAEMFNSSIIP